MPAGEPWALARNVDANLVRDVAGGETERYAFYRGIGARPLRMHVLPDNPDDGADTRVISGNSPATILLEVSADGSAAWSVIGAVDHPVIVRALRRAPRAEAVAALSLAMKRILLEQGLYDDEAQAMIDTWTRTWFLRPGRRLLSIVPTDVVHAELPLTLTPPPQKLVRVFVARTEYQTQADVDALVSDAHRADRSALARRGRFLEPMLRAALARHPDDDALAAILAELTGTRR